jgi:hypothetical protein
MRARGLDWHPTWWVARVCGPWSPFALLTLLAACSPDLPLTLQAEQVTTGFELLANRPIEQVELVDAGGRTHALRTLSVPSTHVWLPASPVSGTWTLKAHAGRDVAASVEEVAEAPPVSVVVEAPFGQGQSRVSEGDVVSLPMVRGQSATLGIGFLAGRASQAVTVTVGDETRALVLDAPGQYRAELFPVVDGTSPLPVQVGFLDKEERPERLSFQVQATPVDAAQARAALRLERSVFPAEASGQSDLARPSGLVTLPSRSWRALLRLADAGTRPRSDQSPWAFEADTLRNDGETDANLVLRFGVVDADGRAVHAFRPRLREANGAIDTVDVLLRVPARGEATAVVPLYVDDQDPALAHPDHPPWFRELAALPMGSTQPLWMERKPLFVRRGSAWASTGILLGIFGALAGFALAFLRFSVWIRRFSTSELVSIALFGTLNFVSATAAWLVGMATGTLLGPFAPLVTGVLDDTFRTVLVATLVTLIPRVGVASLSLLVGYLLRGLALGSFHPVDLLSLGSTIFFLESALYLFGLTRGTAWTSEPRLLRWIRMSCGFGLPAALTMLVSLAVAVVFYRLYYSDLYVMLMVGLPGFAYVVVACGFAVGFAEGLRRVEA